MVGEGLTEVVEFEDLEMLLLLRCEEGRSCEFDLVTVSEGVLTGDAVAELEGESSCAKAC
jgi:hypothetical protein